MKTLSIQDPKTQSKIKKTKLIFHHQVKEAIAMKQRESWLPKYRWGTGPTSNLQFSVWDSLIFCYVTCHSLQRWWSPGDSDKIFVFAFLIFALSFGIFYTKIIYSRSTDITQPSRHSSYHRPSVQILLNYSLWFMNKEWKIQDCKFKVLWCYEQRSPDQTFSVMNGCVRAWLSEILLAGSNMRHLSSKSFSCITLRLCSSFSFL